ncbi:hypothetical protein [Cellulomonas sp. ATA003]|uniref:hypothetical protein n=1 Tax=Cellulomonas sp. ATA003 TaxID=3073064 RepID=UPI0028733F23|nr:hypothetical protein [Cellulomonas sp. ATA003]WNB84406.1 hypothetical protein REH70_11080 [Cellulomonas sp. ATA003]
MALAPSPLFRDPVEDGAADPTLVWNPHERAWWMVYTNRRTTAPFEDGLAWLFGGSLGVASSTDGVRWDYRGTLTGLEVEWGLNTFWAPEIVEHAGTFHMFVSYIRGIPARGSAPAMVMRHYTSPDLVHWTHVAVVPLGADRVIDACVHRLPDGGWRMWFKGEDGGGRTFAADSPDLTSWTVRGHVLDTPGVTRAPTSSGSAGGTGSSSTRGTVSPRTARTTWTSGNRRGRCSRARSGSASPAPTTSAPGCTATWSATGNGRGSSTSRTRTGPSRRTPPPSAGGRRSSSPS